MTPRIKSPLLPAVLLLSGIASAGEIIDAGPADDVMARIEAHPQAEVVRLAPGTYRQPLRLARRLRLEATVPGTVLITGTLPAAPAWRPHPELADAWIAEVERPVAWVRWHRHNLFRYAAPAELATFTMLPGRYLKNPRPGPPQGFAWADGRLHLRFPAGGDPRLTDLAVVEAGGEPLIRVEADGVSLAGLRLDGAAEVGVLARDVRDLAVEDCLFTGMKQAVLNNGKRSAGLRIERCAFHGGSHLAAMRELFARSHHLPGGGFSNALAGIYDGNLEINHVRCEGPGVAFRANVVHSGFDGLQYWDTHQEVQGTPADVPAEVVGNLFTDNLDNAVEMDPARKWLHARVHGNLFVNGINPISLAPVQNGDVRIEGNVLYAALDGSFAWNAFLKLRYFKGARYDLPITGIAVQGNVLYGAEYQLMSTERGGSGSYRDVLIAGNRVVAGRDQGPVREGIILRGNRIRRPDGQPLAAFADQSDDPDLVADPVFDPELPGGRRLRLGDPGPRWNWRAGGPAGDWSVPIPVAVAGIVGDGDGG